MSIGKIGGNRVAGSNQDPNSPDHKLTGKEADLLQKQGVKLNEGDTVKLDSPEMRKNYDHLMVNLAKGNDLTTEDKQMLTALKAQHDAPPPPPASDKKPEDSKPQDVIQGGAASMMKG